MNIFKTKPMRGTEAFETTIYSARQSVVQEVRLLEPKGLVFADDYIIKGDLLVAVRDGVICKGHAYSVKQVSRYGKQHWLVYFSGYAKFKRGDRFCNILAYSLWELLQG